MSPTFKFDQLAFTYKIIRANKLFLSSRWSLQWARIFLANHGCGITEVMNDESVIVKDSFELPFHIWE